MVVIALFIAMVAAFLALVPFFLGALPPRQEGPELHADRLRWSVLTLSRKDSLLGGSLATVLAASLLVGIPTAFGMLFLAGDSGLGSPDGGLGGLGLVLGTLLGLPVAFLAVLGVVGSMARWRSRQVADFQASLDGVRLDIAGAQTTLAWENVTSIALTEQGLLFDGTEPLLVALPRATEDDRQAVLNACQTTFERAQPRLQVPQPAALAKLREG